MTAGCGQRPDGYEHGPCMAHNAGFWTDQPHHEVMSGGHEGPFSSLTVILQAMS